MRLPFKNLEFKNILKTTPKKRLSQGYSKYQKNSKTIQGLQELQEPVNTFIRKINF